MLRIYIEFECVSQPEISYIGKRNDPSSSRLIDDNGSDHINVNLFYSIYLKERIQQLLRQRQKKKIKELFIRY